MKKFSLICLAILLAGTLTPAARETHHHIKASYYYTHGAYFEAIPHLEKAVEKSGNAVLFAQLGDCYFSTGNFEPAAKAYAKAVTYRNCKKEVYLRYAQLLMQLARYDEAAKWLTDYKKTAKQDVRADNMLQGCSTAAAISAQMPPGITTLAPFSTHGSEFAPTLWNGFIVFASDLRIHDCKKRDHATGEPFYSLYAATCDADNHCGTEQKPLSCQDAINIEYHFGPATFSADGKTIYYTRTSFRSKGPAKGPQPRADSLVALDILMAAYDSASRTFGKPKRFEHNSKEYAMAHPAVSPDGKVMALVSNMPKGHGRSDIYISRLQADGHWSKPQNAGPAINTEGDELFPCWAANNTLTFSSDGHAGLGGLDIYSATWDDKTGTCSAPVNAGLLINSSYDDISLAYRPRDEHTWLSSNRPSAAKGDNIYHYRKMEVYLRLTITDSATGQPVPGAGVSIAAAHVMKDTTTGGDASCFLRLWPGDTYTIDARADGYHAGRTRVVATTPKTTDTLNIAIALSKIILQKDPTLTLAAEPLVIRNRNVMDSPGIHGFTLNETYEIGDFQYPYGSYTLNASHQPFLDTMLTQLNRNPSMRIEIQARTDCRGSVASNKILSDKRALSVVNYFVQHGIARSRLQYIGLGNTRPKAPCPDCKTCTEKQHSLNRILEFKVLEL